MGKLRKITQKELEKIIENHKHWLKEDCVGWEDMRADLSYTDLNNKDLRYADLYNANLNHANLSNANLYNADLNHANLSNADLIGADLYNANLNHANLYNADLYSADLYNANLNHANLYNADLEYTDFSNASLSKADLSNANLRYADLSYGNLENANLRHADLYNAKLKNAKINFPLACPPKGSFTAWKKADGKIVKLQILEDSKRLSATTNKCRCDKALVLEIQDLKGNKLDIESVRSDYDKDFVYKVGEIVSVNDFDENRWNECSTGIHFFFDRQLAVDY